MDRLEGGLVGGHAARGCLGRAQEGVDVSLPRMQRCLRV